MLAVKNITCMSSRRNLAFSVCLICLRRRRKNYIQAPQARFLVILVIYCDINVKSSSDISTLRNPNITRITLSVASNVRVL